MHLINTFFQANRLWCLEDIASPFIIPLPLVSAWEPDKEISRHLIGHHIFIFIIGDHLSRWWHVRFLKEEMVVIKSADDIEHPLSIWLPLVSDNAQPLKSKRISKILS